MSRLGALVKFIKTLTFSPALAGIGPNPLPLNATFPYVIVREIFSVDQVILTGRNGTTRSILQVEVWSKGYDEAYHTRETIKNGLIDYAGALDARTTIGPIAHVIDVELYDARVELHQLISRFEIWWEN